MHSKYLGSDLSEHELLKDFVVQALKRQSNIKDVLIPQIIEKTGWNWPMSEQFVKQVQTEYGIEISVFTEQLYLYLGWGIVLVGVGLILIMYETTYGFGALAECLHQDLHGSLVTPVNFLTCVGWLNPGYLQEFSNYAYIGFMMTIGGTIGIVKALINLQAHGQIEAAENNDE